MPQRIRLLPVVNLWVGPRYVQVEDKGARCFQVP